jgi:hypothetical protein
MNTFTCDICHASRPSSELAPFDLLNLAACRPCVRASQVAAIRESDAIYHPGLNDNLDGAPDSEITELYGLIQPTEPVTP